MADNTYSIPLSVGDVSQSAIKEGEDQLFLDTADADRLNTVTSNYGLDRPISGHGDDEWRAIAKQIMLKSKAIRTAFERVLEVCFGPQFYRVSELAEAASVGDKIITVEDASQFPQIGTLVLDDGQSTEEEVDFIYSDPVTNQIFLKTELIHNHVVRTEASSRLRANVAVGATSLLLDSTSSFPTSGYPYTIILDQGTLTEEILTVSNNNTMTNTLTCSATQYAHSGPKADLVQRPISAATFDGRTFLKFSSTHIKQLPFSGFLRINPNGGTEEIVEYVSLDIDTLTVNLKTPLVNNHSSGEKTDLIIPGAPVSLASVAQAGANWDVIETENHKLHIIVPERLIELQLPHASWLHDTVPSPFSTTLAANASAGATSIQVVSSSGFPDEAGMVLINGTEVAFYIFRDEATNRLYLTQSLAGSFTMGQSVALYTVAYSGTDLEDGNFRDSGGNIRLEHFPGPYVYDFLQDGPKNTMSPLTAIVPNPTRVSYIQQPGRTCLEVVDASLWPSSPTFDVRIGVRSGFEETASCSSRTLKSSASTTVSSNISAGVTTIPLVSSTAFPGSNGTHPAGYRIRVGAGTANDETLFVDQKPGGTSLTVNPATTKAHNMGETVTILSDILSLSTLTKQHAGPTINPSTFGHLVEPLIEQIELTNSTGFTTDGGTVILNYGKEIPNARSKIVTLGSATSYTLASTSKFPTTNFPYQVVINPGGSSEERVSVTANNIMTNTLTFAAPGAINTHIATEYVEFTSGDPETVDYDSISGNNLIISTPTVLSYGHLIGENVMLSSGANDPREDGFSFDFKLPPDPADCFNYVFELIKAAGVKIIVHTQR